MELVGRLRRGAAGVSARHWLWGLIFLGLGFQIGTLLVEPQVPLVDLPNHMARHVLEADWLAGRPLPPFYRIDYRVLPNLGGDLVIPLLLLVLAPQAACKVFLSVAVLVYWLGPTLYILRACGGVPALAASALLLPLSFSSQLFLGFFNFYSGFGLAFLVLVHWVRLLSRGDTRAWEWGAHALLVALLFVWHLAVWGIYGVLAACQLVMHLRERRRAGATAGDLAKGGLAFVMVCSASLVLLGAYVLDHVGTTLGQTDWGPLARKGLLALSMFHGYDSWSDAVVIVTWVAAAAWLFVIPRSALAWTPHLLGLVVLGVLYLAIPFQLAGTSDTDSRLLPAMLVCAAAVLGGLPIRRLGLGLFLLAVCLLVRQGSIHRAWRERALSLDAKAGAFDRLPIGSRVLPMVLVPALTKKHPELHFPCWAAALRRAFVPTLFAFQDQQPLKLVAPAPVAATLGPRGWEIDETAARKSYDFVWLDNPKGVPVSVPASFERVFVTGSLELWRVGDAR